MDEIGELVVNENFSESFKLFMEGTELWSKFLNSSNLEDLDNGIGFLVKSISLLPNGDTRTPGRLDCLFSCYFARYELLGGLEDLNKAIEHATQAYDLTSEGDPDLLVRHKNAYMAHQCRFEHQEDLENLNKSIDYATQALAFIPQDHGEYPDISADLGGMLLVRSRHLGNMEDLNKSMNYYTQAYNLTPTGHSSLPDRLSTLSTTYFDRYTSLGDIEDLNNAIEYEIQAHSITPEGDPDLAERLSGLCVSYGQRFQRLRDLSDVDKAIDYGIQSCELTPRGDYFLPGRLMYLGIAYHERYVSLGDANDLNKSIEHKVHAYNIAPADFLDLPQLLCSLGASYNRRFIDEENSRIGDIDKAIQYQEQAKALMPEAHSDFHRWLSRLGSSYHNRARHSKDVGDLNKAIENMFQAHSLTPTSDPSLAWQLSNIGALFYARYERIGSLDDLNQAIEYHERAYVATPDQHPDITLILLYLGRCYKQRFQSLSEQDSLNKALDYFSRGASSSGYPISRLEAALDWARLCAESGTPNQLHGYQAAIQLIPEVIWVGVTVDERYRTLGRLSNIATEAASAAIASNQLELALEWLEQGRSVVWNQTLLLQSPLDELRESFPSLADKLQGLGNALYRTSARSDFESQEVTKNSPTPDQVAQMHHQLAREYTDQISHIRGLPGFSNFLKPKKASDLVRAASVGPVVMINCHENQCDALIISPGGLTIHHAPLPSFTNKDARELRAGLERLLGGDNMRQRGILLRPRPTKKQIQFKDALATLWKKVAKPILEVLQYKPQPQTEIDNFPHITWCATGELSFIPLHAAGEYNQPNASVMDYAISSYTPTLTALVNSTSVSSGGHSTLLSVGQEATPGQASLPGTKEELAYIQKHTNATIKHTQLVDYAATTESVLSAMEHHDWIHLSCHASQNAKYPTESGFHLHDGTLDLMAIMRKSFKNKGLAFLSACQTAKGDENLPEEAVHLASGLLTAGYSGAIASMWAVHDRDAPLIADMVYSQVLKDGKLHTQHAAKALHMAVIELRQRVGVAKYSRWAQYIHFGS
ncbi:unnamed protein product [Rhizoctonia solani]|uniref:CHAT domain-containing protein n=1 Tax=Rhizoctonia solani TaxID=456999 RepID=A0A8H2WBJ7_9AGAM|nr:unnamed protein product [Rhizoctonia solani]